MSIFEAYEDDDEGCMTPSRPLIYRSCNQYSSLSQATHVGKDVNFTRSKGGRHEMLLRTENLGNFAIVGVPETHRPFAIAIACRNSRARLVAVRITTHQPRVHQHIATVALEAVLGSGQRKRAYRTELDTELVGHPTRYRRNG